MAATGSASQRANEFLASAHLYRLGRLPTEQSHPATRNLADLVRNDLPQASRLLQMVDLQALMKFQLLLPRLSNLSREVLATLQRGGRIFICGCGATGRLALTLEYLWRTLHPEDPDRVVAFMAGGDVALVHSLEGFEDFPDYGREQLSGLGFKEGDLLISSTEGGETPFVIGATEAAVELSSRPVFFLYCNPRDILRAEVERSRRVFENPRIENIELFVGPMALAGSTRMQASTVLELAIGLVLFERCNLTELGNRVGQWLDQYRELPVARIVPFIERESEIYKEGGRVTYEVEDLAITVFTDTTERSPTFSLPPFNNQKFPREQHSLVYVSIPSASGAGESWLKLLRRKPRSLEWRERNAKTCEDYLNGFDFGRGVAAYRKRVLPEAEHFSFSITMDEKFIRWQLGTEILAIPRAPQGLLYDHLFLKMLLNIHSTLVMGRLGRFESNFMTYVMPTNGKLVDRAMRYVKWLLEVRGQAVPPDDIVVQELFRQLEALKEGESVVLKTADHLAISMA